MEENGLAAMLATKRSAGVTREVNLREDVICMPPPNVNKAAHSGFEKFCGNGIQFPPNLDACKTDNKFQIVIVEGNN